MTMENQFEVYQMKQTPNPNQSVAFLYPKYKQAEK